MVIYVEDILKRISAETDHFKTDTIESEIYTIEEIDELYGILKTIEQKFER